MNNYTIDGVTTGVGSEAGVLNFSLTSVLTDADKAKLVLHIDDSSDTFAFSVGAPVLILASTTHGPASGLDWSSESEVTAAGARGGNAPGRTDQLHRESGRHAGDARLESSGVGFGSDGPRVPVQDGRGLSQETWTAIADSGPDETNEDSFTVTGLTNEEAHTFELRAVNTAGGGDAAEAGPVTPTPGICDRTQQIQDAILGEISRTWMTARR